MSSHIKNEKAVMISFQILSERRSFNGFQKATINQFPVICLEGSVVKYDTFPWCLLN